MIKQRAHQNSEDFKVSLKSSDGKNRISRKAELSEGFYRSFWQPISLPPTKPKRKHVRNSKTALRKHFKAKYEMKMFRPHTDFCR